ncbi:MAG: hypothetical protein WCR52_08375 [Bacteroidota bacterium]
MTSNKPNLFSFATSELSQDAIIAWLIQWADPRFESHDRALHETARYFIRKMYGSELVEIDEININPQEYKIDLLIRLKCKDGIERIILLEDKVYAHAHGDQLNRYLKRIEDIHASREHILPIFLKTGFQQDWSEARAAGYREITATDLLDVWQFGEKEGIKNDIFADFGVHLRKLAREFEQAGIDCKDFENHKVATWNHWHWVGFFTKMKTVFPNSDFAHNQFRRDSMLSYWFGFVPFGTTSEDHSIQFGPNFDLAISRGKPALTIRMWIQELSKKGIGFREYRRIVLEKLQPLNLGTAGKLKNAKDSILLTKIEANLSDMSAQQLQDYLQSLQAQLQAISASDDQR